MRVSWILARNLHLTDGNRKCDALKQREVDVDIEGFGLESGEPVRDRGQCFADGIEVVE